MKKFFKLLNQLQQIIFFCYIKRDYYSKSADYEEQIRRTRIKLFRQMKKIRALMKGELSHLENLYEIIFSLNTLKLRVKDHATFEVCENEMKLLSQCITNILIAAQSPEKKDISLINQFSSAVQGLDDLYHGTLQIVCHEPIVFLFFIQDLIALRENLEDLMRAQ